MLLLVTVQLEHQWDEIFGLAWNCLLSCLHTSSASLPKQPAASLQFARIANHFHFSFPYSSKIFHDLSITVWTMKTDKALYPASICQLISWRAFGFSLGSLFVCLTSDFHKRVLSCDTQIHLCPQDFRVLPQHPLQEVRGKRPCPGISSSSVAGCFLLEPHQLVVAHWSPSSALGANNGKVSWFLPQINLHPGSSLFKNHYLGILWTH